MKKDRYPNMGYMPPHMNMNQGMMPVMPYNQGMIDNNMETTLNNLQAQINMLDKRVTKLESMYCANDNYNSNYHVM